MFGRTIVRRMATTTTTAMHGPVESVMRERLTAALSPALLEIHNDSSLHGSNRGNEGVKETHFRVTIVSEHFAGQRLAARHRAVYGLLREEMARAGGIHALQLRCKTAAEQARDEEENKAKTRPQPCLSRSS